MKVFVYGSLKKGYWNHRVMEIAGGEFLGNSKIKGAKIYYYYNSPFPAISFAGGDNDIVIGEVYKIKNIKPLDLLEGYPNFYNRKLVETDHGLTWTYYMDNISHLKEITSGEWLG